MQEWKKLRKDHLHLMLRKVENLIFLRQAQSVAVLDYALNDDNNI